LTTFLLSRDLAGPTYPCRRETEFEHLPLLPHPFLVSLSDKLLRVFIIRMDGKVGSRTVGPPAWPKLVKSVESLPERDQYGTP
jgi:hypothetical protein